MTILQTDRLFLFSYNHCYLQREETQIKSVSAYLHDGRQLHSNSTEDLCV